MTRPELSYALRSLNTDEESDYYVTIFMKTGRQFKGSLGFCDEFLTMAYVADHDDRHVTYLLIEDIEAIQGDVP